MIRVASSLNNRLLARGSYSGVLDSLFEIGGQAPQLQTTEVHDHGLLGPVRLLRKAVSRSFG